MIAVENIQKSFGAIRAVDGVTFSVQPGCLCGLLGPNGAGKTTLFKILMGLAEPDGGQIRFANELIQFGATEYKRTIGYVPETPVLYEYLTGLEFLQFVSAIKKIPSEAAGSDMEYWLDFFALGEKAVDLIKTYSNGMRRKLSICAALIGQPRILLLDEATNGLDPESNFRFKNYLRDFCTRGGTILFSTHVIEIVEHLCDRIVILHQGRILRQMQQKEWEGLRQQGSSLEQEFIALVKPAIT